MIYQDDRSGRYDGSGGLNGMIVISLAAHLLLLFLFAFSPSRPAPKWTFGPVYSVQLVTAPAGMSERKAGGASLREITEGAPSDRYVLKKESIDSLPSVPIGPIEIRKKQVGGNIDHALEAVRKTVSSAEGKPASPPALKETGVTASPGVQSPAGQSDGKTDAGMAAYYSLIWSRIKGAWSLPPGILSSGNIEAVIHARILRDGTVTDVDFEKRSGNRYFDASALRTVKKAGPFPPLPRGFRDSSMEVGIRFHSSEFR